MTETEKSKIDNFKDFRDKLSELIAINSDALNYATPLNIDSVLAKNIRRAEEKSLQAEEKSVSKKVPSNKLLA